MLCPALEKAKAVAGPACGRNRRHLPDAAASLAALLGAGHVGDDRAVLLLELEPLQLSGAQGEADQAVPGDEVRRGEPDARRDPLPQRGDLGIGERSDAFRVDCRLAIAPPGLQFLGQLPPCRLPDRAGTVIGHLPGAGAC